MPLQAGTLLGRYEIVVPLGAGGMGEVYRARDTRLGRSVAIKVLRGGVERDDDLRARVCPTQNPRRSPSSPTGPRR